MTSVSDIDYPIKIVAYLDILGFRKLVFQSRDGAAEAIAKIDSALSNGIEWLSLEEGPDWFTVKLFSDCFCISCEHTSSNLQIMLREISLLQWYLATEGIFVAGGLSTGPHYENERVIFSEGLIRAYELQNPDTTPRVTVDPAIVKQIGGMATPLGNTQLLAYILKDEDGISFVDYLQGAFDVLAYSGNEDDVLESHKKAILEQVRLNQSNPRVIAKYKWLAGYHNYKFAELYSEDDWVEGYFQELRDRLVIPADTFPTFQRMGDEGTCTPTF